MKFSNLKSAIKQSKQRGSVALLLLICVLWIAAVSVAQVATQSRVTGLQLGDTPEGSRVTVVSDAALADYEAFRRGDRFYVKIPMANLATAVPTFRAAGFDDMQVQRQSGSVMISFKLQPGATARVNQRGNRLEVIFSSPIRTGANSAAGANRSYPVSRDRGPDAAGPIPEDTTASASRTRVVGNQNAAVDESRFSPSVFPRGSKTSSSSSKNSNNSKVAPSGPVTQPSTAVNSATPTSSPSSILSPGNPNTYTPVGSSSPTTTVSSTTNPVGSNTSAGWRNRFESAKRWMLANKLATFLGALILLSLIIYLMLAMRGRRENGYKARSAKTPKVQPTFRAGEELREVAATNAAVKQSEVPKQTAARSAAAASSANTDRVVTKPTRVSTPVAQAEQNSEPEDREVFEL